MKVTAAYFQVDGAPSPPTNIWLNKEYIVVRNMGTTSAVLTGWTLRDLARPGIPSHVYKFPTSFHLAGGAIVRVHTGAGTNTAADLYWHLTVFVWGDDSDTATLKNASAVTVSTCAWTDSNVAGVVFDVAGQPMAQTLNQAVQARSATEG